MSLPQIAFSIIFPLAVLILIAGWSAALVAYLRRDRKGSKPARHPYLPRRRSAQPRDAWSLVREALPAAARRQLPPQP